jgi:hypothetical protein
MADIRLVSIKSYLTRLQLLNPPEAYAGAESDRIQPLRGQNIRTRGNDPSTSLPQPMASPRLKPTLGSRQAYIEAKNKILLNIASRIPFPDFYPSSNIIRYGDCIRNTVHKLPGEEFLVLGLFKGMNQVPQESIFTFEVPSGFSGKFGRTLSYFVVLAISSA